MPRYNYECSKCGEIFEELFLSFSAADAAEKDGLECPKGCGQQGKRDTNPGRAWAGGSFSRWGLWTYGGAGN